MFSDLELYRARKTIKELARANGVSEADIRAEMNKAIEVGFSAPDSSVRDAWAASPFNSKKPTPEEFILWCASQIDSQE